MKIAASLGVGLIVISLIGCTGPASPTPGVGKKFDCGYAIEGDGGLAIGKFDVSGDGRTATQLSVSPPYRKRFGYRCEAASKMSLQVAITDGQEHRLQCRLYRDGQQVDEDHAGSIVSMTDVNPRVTCRYP